MKRTANIIFLTIYLCYWFFTACARVGELSKPSTEPFSWWLPLAVLVGFGFPALIGFEIGRDSK